ncbi:hypothetical protein J2T18_004428 [Paenibacillus polymyxa]|nr:hypothetical protein [Paenibacillus polymyxa]
MSCAPLLGVPMADRCLRTATMNCELQKSGATPQWLHFYYIPSYMSAFSPLLREASPHKRVPNKDQHE